MTTKEQKRLITNQIIISINKKYKVIDLTYSKKSTIEKFISVF